jgi:hypothetical protein
VARNRDTLLDVTGYQGDVRAWLRSDKHCDMCEATDGRQVVQIEHASSAVSGNPGRVDIMRFCRGCLTRLHRLI